LKIIKVSGEYSDIWFVYGDKTDVYESCSVTYQNRFYIFGGHYEKRQISMINGCKLERTGDLNFDFYYGSCGAFSMPEEVVLLCFPATSSDRTKCWSYNGLYSVKLGFVSNIGHYRAV